MDTFKSGGEKWASNLVIWVLGIFVSFKEEDITGTLYDSGNLNQY